MMNITSSASKKLFSEASLVLFAAMMTIACGDSLKGRPTYSSSAPSGTLAPSASEQLSTKNAASDAEKKADDAERKAQDTAEDVIEDDAAAPAPVVVQTPARLTIRTEASAAEKATMTTQYAGTPAQGGCVQCHGPLATSAKKGRTALQIQNIMGAFQHRAIAASGKWPRNVVDTTDDGIDQAQLLANALSDILK